MMQFIVLYTVFVIVWGAYVRATGSGDGCGSHWPLCNGEVIPLNPSLKMKVEFSHRISSALLGFAVFGVWWASRRISAPCTQLRRIGNLVGIFTVIEAILGAVLVKRGLVTTNPSWERAAVMGIHLCNTLILVGVMVAFAWALADRGQIRLLGRGKFSSMAQFSIAGVFLMGLSGALAALGDTLYPSKHWREGLAADFNPNSPTILLLRTWHPIVAVAVGVMLIVFMRWLRDRGISKSALKSADMVVNIVFMQILCGFLNVFLAAPVWMQMVHLFLANALWVAVLWALFGASLTETEVVSTESSYNGSVKTNASPGSASGFEQSEGPLWKAYLALTKPRVISLLLFTTLATMVIAAGGWPGTTLFFAVFIGGYAMAGAANTFNMVYDRDIDLRMERTSHRPTVTHQISPSAAMTFGGLLMVGSFGLLTWAANFLTALMALCGLLFYIFVYTIGLKRRSTQNIVIGGAAGAFPPLVGYAAVANQLPALAWVLFALIFLWTPVHFWALALMIKDEYKDVGIPMLPVVKGDRATVVQIGFYTILTVACSLIPIIQGEARTLYLLSAIILNIFFVLFSVRLVLRQERSQAFAVFKFSMVYLALLFLMIAVDRARWM